MLASRAAASPVALQDDSVSARERPAYAAQPESLEVVPSKVSAASVGCHRPHVASETTVPVERCPVAKTITSIPTAQVGGNSARIDPSEMPKVGASLSAPSANASSSTAVPPGVSAKASASKLLVASRSFFPFEAHLAEDYSKSEKIGEGTYGTVWRSRCPNTDITVAVKKVELMGKEKDFPVTAIREIRNLRKLQHKNIVQLLNVVAGTEGDKADVYLVFEYAPSDLTGLLAYRKQKLNIREVKCLTIQLLEAVDYCHIRRIMHRDLKPSNILVTGDGTLKLCDFGLSREMDKHRDSGNYSTRVITLWYRPPELLLGAKEYDQSVDIWSAGCIFGELLLGVALFPEATEIGVLQRICKRLGMSSEDKWPHALRGLSQWDKLYGALFGGRRRPPVPEESAAPHIEGDIAVSVRNRYGAACEQLLRLMLELDPAKRCCAENALKHSFFAEDPEPCKESDIKLPQNLSCHELDVKRHREKVQAQRQAMHQAATGKRAGPHAGATVTDDVAAAPVAKRQRPG